MHTPPRPGRLSSAWLVFVASGGLLAGLVALLAFDPARWTRRASETSLVVYCAAGLKVPVEKAAREYEEAYGVEVQLQYGGSNTLLASLQVSDRADLYVPAEDAYVESALSMQTAGVVRGLRPWLTNEYQHNGLRAAGDLILNRLMDLAFGRE